MTARAVSITSVQTHLRVPRTAIQKAVRAAFRLAGRRPAPVSVVVVDDREIRRLHRDFFDLDTATDVISFPLEGGPEMPGTPFGEVVASAETARRVAGERGHPPTHELVLYVAHGVLHLLGFDDHTEVDRAAMRDAERRCLRAAGIRRDLFRSRS